MTDRGSFRGRILSRWWLIVILTIVGGLIGFGRYVLQDREYAATSTLLIGRPLSDAQLDQDALLTAQHLAQTYADLVTRQPVLQGAAQQLGLRVPWQELRGRVDASVPGESPVVIIDVRAATSAQAVALAKAIDNQVIAASPSASEDSHVADVQKFVETRLQRTERMIGEAQAHLDELRQAAAEASGPHATSLGVQVARAEAHVLDLQQSYATLLSLVSSGGVTNAVSVLESPSLEATPSDSGLVASVAVGAAVGFLFGVFLASVLRRSAPAGNERSPKGVDRLVVPTAERGSARTR